MTVKANGTDAKDIATHFISATTGRATPAIMSKTINQAKILLQSNYTKEEIIDVIDYIIDVKKVHMYSLGYVSTCVNNMLSEINAIKNKEKAKQQEQELKQKMVELKEELKQSEVIENSKSTERNRDKLNRFGTESRVGEKFNFDMFKGQ